MPLPLILIGIAVTSGLVGLGSGAKAASDTSRASRLRKDSEDDFNHAEEELQQAKDTAKDQLNALGETKLHAWNEQLGTFVKLFEQLRNVEITGGVADEFFLHKISKTEMLEIKQISIHASEVIGGGLAAAGAGTLAGFGAYGGATMFASASTGTAISSLSGVAATNATMAWFGGGSLASGGLGMAGGTMVLGGLVAGPVLLVSGIALSAVAQKRLAETQKNAAEAKKAIAEIHRIVITLHSIEKFAKQFDDFIHQLLPHVDNSLTALAEVIERMGVDYSTFENADKQKVFLAVGHADLLKQVLETPLLSEDGAIHNELPNRMKAFSNANLQLEITSTSTQGS